MVSGENSLLNFVEDVTKRFVPVVCAWLAFAWVFAKCFPGKAELLPLVIRIDTTRRIGGSHQGCVFMMDGCVNVLGLSLESMK